MRRLLGGLAVTAVLCGFSLADDHHNGHQLLGNKINTNATHRIHGNAAGHSVHARTEGGKVQSMHARNGNTTVNVAKHVKSGKRHHAMLETQDGTQFVSHIPMDEGNESDCQGFAIQYIGFYFNLGNQIFIFWYPVAIVDPGIINSAFTYP